MESVLVQRQTFVGDDSTTTFVDDDGRHGNFWFSTKAEIIKWAIVAAITLIFVLWVVGGYFHAKRRVRKGLKPLRYHKFLLPRSQRAQFEPQNNFSFYRQDDRGYRMEPYVPPPPSYSPNLVPPPSYVAPEGASKVAPSQDWIAPPPGPPPNRSPDYDVEQGTAADTGNATSVKGGKLLKLIQKMPKLR